MAKKNAGENVVDNDALKKSVEELKAKTNAPTSKAAAKTDAKTE